MIAVILYGNWLKREEAERGLAGIPDKIGYYTNYRELYPDKDKVEILINTGPPDESVIAQMPSLKWIFSYSAGVDAYPMELIKDKGIFLSNTSGVHKTNMAEQVLGGMIMFSRNLLQAMANKSNKIWQSYPLDELTGRDLLIIGTGRIGSEIARKAKAFDMNVYGVRLREGQTNPGPFDAIYPVSRLDEVLPGKHYVCLVVPQTEQTRGLMGEAQFARMDSRAVFINVGRGETVREEALIRALSKKTIRGAMLDVFEQEPLPQDSPLWDLPNLIITPHNAGPTPHYAERAFRLFCTSFELYRKGDDLPNLVDPDRRY